MMTLKNKVIIQKKKKTVSTSKIYNFKVHQNIILNDLISIAILHFNISQYCGSYCIFYQINASLDHIKTVQQH